MLITNQDENLRYEYLAHTSIWNGWINKKEDKYTVLKSDLSPEQIVERDNKNILSKLSFIAFPTNWNGCDEFERTCEFCKIKPVKWIDLKSILIIAGVDYDCGHVYSWKLDIDKIATVEKS